MLVALLRCSTIAQRIWHAVAKSLQIVCTIYARTSALEFEAVLLVTLDLAARAFLFSAFLHDHAGVPGIPIGIWRALHNQEGH
jgi:hypothetical protein